MTDADLSSIADQVVIAVAQSTISGRLSSLVDQVVVAADVATVSARLSALRTQVVVQRRKGVVEDFDGNVLMVWSGGQRYPVEVFS